MKEQLAIIESILQQPDAAVLDDLHRYGSRCPELDLVWAVFEDGIRTFTGHVISAANRHQKVNIREEARRWIFDRQDEDWIFSFEGCCTALELDADYWRLLCRNFDLKDSVRPLATSRVGREP